MRRTITTLTAFIVMSALSGIASAQTWNAELRFLDGPTSCTRNPSPYVYVLNGSTFAGLYDGKQTFSTTVGANGEIDQPYKSLSGTPLRITGNVRTRDLIVTNPAGGCRWKAHFLN